MIEVPDEWTEARRYMGLDVLAKARLRDIYSEVSSEETRKALKRLGKHLGS
ncbi:hypothetical protein N5079_16440 [Planotetraspora sp. A-T 1434]|uniref:hypothetical protein n=1 Tax=Planotetraspora sp. A-T 1434 TaxID=2979219 RepID=UPI0021C21881|nr:hypothetical protein [Planotetraspora sp. A-T 1434]MCT9931802.1 hypothetical protein [Planotetraspora sp. A-T 1434]